MATLDISIGTVLKENFAYTTDQRKRWNIARYPTSFQTKWTMACHRSVMLANKLSNSPRQKYPVTEASRKLFLCSVSVAASRMQIVPQLPPVAGKFPLHCMQLHVHLGTICMQLAATQVQFECDLPLAAYNFCTHWQLVQSTAASFIKAHCQNNYLN
jgi:hypothetical protein